MLLFARPAYAVNGWWNTTTTGDWSNVNNWWTTAAGATNVASVPGAGQTATFNGNGVNGSSIVQLSSDTTVGPISFVNTGMTQLQSNNLTARTLTVNSATGVTVSGGTVNLADTLNLSMSAGADGTNVFKINSGVVNIAGTVNTNTGNLKDTTVAGVAGRAVLNINGGTLTTRWLQAGTISGGNGAINVTPGSTVTTNASNNAVFTFGGVDGSYGAFNMTGGTVNTPRLQVSGNNATAGGIGVATISGGTLNTDNYVLLVRSGNNAVGVLSVLGGTINHAGISPIMLGYGHAGRAELNVLGGTINNPNHFVQLGGLEGAASFSGTAIVNLNAGSLSTRGIQKNTGSNARVNFNGGTLKAEESTTSFLNNFSGGSFAAHVNGAFGDYAGGAVIDTNGYSVGIAASLSAPTGDGVATLAVANGGSGYIGAPHVAISGTGNGATAIANMADDGTGNGTLRVASITVTNPGVNYTGTPTYTFSGGGFLSAATPGTVTTAANTSGGLTKQGLGTLTLSGNNTYIGTTTIDAGTLALTTTGTNNIASSARIHLATAGSGLNVTNVTGAGGFALASGQTLTGIGTVTGDSTVAAGSILSPGNSPGVMPFVGNHTWAGLGTLVWEINGATGVAGTNWDLVTVSNQLNITATPGNQFNIDIVGLTAGNAQGIVPGFDNLSSYAWLIADSAVTINSFDADAFNLLTANFTSNNALGGGTFGIARGDFTGIGGDDTQIYLTFTPAAVPEPGSLAVFGVAALVLWGARRRYRRKSS